MFDLPQCDRDEWRKFVRSLSYGPFASQVKMIVSDGKLACQTLVLIGDQLVAHVSHYKNVEFSDYRMRRGPVGLLVDRVA